MANTTSGTTTFDKTFSIDEIIEEAFERLGIQNITGYQLKTSRRSINIARPRQIAMFLCKELTSYSYPEIGRAFSNRDHTTVIHSVKTIDRLRKNDNELSGNIESLKNKILFKKENEI